MLIFAPFSSTRSSLYFSGRTNSVMVTAVQKLRLARSTRVESSYGQARIQLKYLYTALVIRKRLEFNMRMMKSRRNSRPTRKALVRLPVSPSPRLPVCPSARLPVCPSPRLPVCPSVRSLARSPDQSETPITHASSTLPIVFFTHEPASVESISGSSSHEGLCPSPRDAQ